MPLTYQDNVKLSLVAVFAFWAMLNKSTQEFVSNTFNVKNETIVFFICLGLAFLLTMLLNYLFAEYKYMLDRTQAAGRVDMFTPKQQGTSVKNLPF